MICDWLIKCYLIRFDWLRTRPWCYDISISLLLKQKYTSLATLSGNLLVYYTFSSYRCHPHFKGHWKAFMCDQLSSIFRLSQGIMYSGLNTNSESHNISPGNLFMPPSKEDSSSMAALMKKPHLSHFGGISYSYAREHLFHWRRSAPHINFPAFLSQFLIS